MMSVALWLCHWLPEWGCNFSEHEAENRTRGQAVASYIFVAIACDIEFKALDVSYN